MKETTIPLTLANIRTSFCNSLSFISHTFLPPIKTVMRHQGSLKVILNTKLWPHTHLRRPARRNLQVTATDVETQAVRVFLIQASARDVARLYVAIHHRLVALRASAAGREAEAAGGRTREGHCNSENEEEEEEERQQKEREERLLLTRLRPGKSE